MNLFFRELKSYRIGLFWWTIGMIAMVGSGMAKFATFQSTGQSMNALLDQFPKSIQTIFGMTGFDLSKASGYCGVLFMYIALMATIHAVLLGAGIISKEERDRTSEFLFAKPISRFKVITAKIVAGLFNLVIINIVTFLSSVYFIDYFSKGAYIMNNIVVLMAGLFFLQLLFFFAGTAIAAAHKKPKTSMSMATSVLLFTFILSVLINVNERLDVLKYLTPFRYFDARDLMTSGLLDLVYMSISSILIIIMIMMTYRAYDKRDLSV